jgi:hypothetical protein
MKHFIKIASLLLAFMFFFCACEQAETETVPEYETTFSGTDLGGATVSWGFSMDRYHDNIENVFGFIPGSVFADQATERKKQIENDYNCKIVIDNNSSSYIINDRLNASIVSGSHLYDITTSDSSLLRGMVRSGGFLLGLSSLLDVQNTDKWGPPNMLYSMLWKDDLYGVVPFAWPELLYSTTGHIIAVNETIVSQLAQPDPREFVENNTWTWDKFEEVLHAYTYQDAGRTVYAMNTHNAYFAMNMFLSNGVTFSSYENGEVVCGVYTDPGRAALERAQSIHNDTCKDCFYPADSSDLMYIQNGDSVMVVTSHGGLISTTDSLMYKMDNIGILPFPLGPNATPGIYRSYYEQIAFTTVIPVNTADAQSAALVLSAMYEPLPGLETKDDIAEYMATQIFFDIRDAEVFINTVTNTEYGFFWEGGRGAIESSVNANTSISQILESMKSRYDGIVEDFLGYHYAGRDAVYGD